MTGVQLITLDVCSQTYELKKLGLFTKFLFVILQSALVRIDLILVNE